MGLWSSSLKGFNVALSCIMIPRATRTGYVKTGELPTNFHADLVEKGKRERKSRAIPLQKGNIATQHNVDRAWSLARSSTTNRHVTPGAGLPTGGGTVQCEERTHPHSPKTPSSFYVPPLCQEKNGSEKSPLGGGGAPAAIIDILRVPLGRKNNPNFQDS